MCGWQTLDLEQHGEFNCDGSSVALGGNYGN